MMRKSGVDMESMSMLSVISTQDHPSVADREQVLRRSPKVQPVPPEHRLFHDKSLSATKLSDNPFVMFYLRRYRHG